MINSSDYFCPTSHSRAHLPLFLWRSAAAPWLQFHTHIMDTIHVFEVELDPLTTKRLSARAPRQVIESPVPLDRMYLTVCHSHGELNVLLAYTVH